MINQTTEPENKIAMSNDKPERFTINMEGFKQDDPVTGLSAIALKSMQIAENKAQQNNKAASHQEAELHQIVKQYLNR